MGSIYSVLNILFIIIKMITQSTLEEIENKEGYLYGIISSEIQIYLGISDKPLNPSTGLTTF